LLIELEPGSRNCICISLWYIIQWWIIFNFWSSSESSL